MGPLLRIHPLTPIRACGSSMSHLKPVARGQSQPSPLLPGEARPQRQSRGAQILGGGALGQLPCHKKSPLRATFTETLPLFTQPAEKGVSSTPAFLLSAHRWEAHSNTAAGHQRAGRSGPLPQKAVLNVIQGSLAPAQKHRTNQSQRNG